MKNKKPKFTKQLYLFEITDKGPAPIKKIELSDQQKDMLLTKQHVMMRMKTRFMMLAPGKDCLVDNKPKLNLYMPVIDSNKERIVILGVYKVDEEVEEETIH